MQCMYCRREFEIQRMFFFKIMQWMYCIKVEENLKYNDRTYIT
jgi:hypothetical protein